MNRFARLAALSLACAAPVSGAPSHARQAPAGGVEQLADELLAADRGFASAAAGLDTVAALSAQFHDDVTMPLPDGSFARGRDAAVAALRANPYNFASRAEWTPVRVGISADGRHGFTFGFMTLRGNDGSVRLAKYLAYWVQTPQGWRVAAYKRAPRPEGEVSLAMLAPSLPDRLVGSLANPAPTNALAAELRGAEQAFSDEAQRVGLGAAFRRNGRVDAMNMGAGAGFTLGAEAIGNAIGGDAPPSPVRWGADRALVAGSGDLGVTFGLIRPNGAVPEGRPDAIPFFTIWRREEGGRWLYIAE